MEYPASLWPRRWVRLARWASCLCVVGLPLIGLGCTQFQTGGWRPEAGGRQLEARGQSGESGNWRPETGSAKFSRDPKGNAGSVPTIVRTSAQEVQQLPLMEVKEQKETTPAPPAPSLQSPASSPLPINLETVLRLAEEQNPQIALYRERVREACAEKCLAEKRWLPDLFVGPTYYRHEGGIQDFDGTLIHSSTGALFAGLEANAKLDLREYTYQTIQARRKIWQQRGELSRITSETLLESAGTYVDLLTAHSGEAVTRALEKDLNNLLERAEKLANTEPGARVEVARIKAELGGHQQLTARLQGQSRSASAKLAYLLGVDSCSEMVPVDSQLVPIDLVDATPPTCELVSRAMTSGPGVCEMEGLLALIHESQCQAEGPSRWLPTFGVRMAEGAFGAGPGDAMRWDNRWDVAVQARWNLTDCLTSCERRRVARSKIHQAHLAYDDLRGKLTAGVQDARETILSSRQQIRLAEEQISEARRAFQLSNERLKNNVPGSSPSEVLLALRAVALAQTGYITAVNAYDKAQIRLMVLLGQQ